MENRDGTEGGRSYLEETTLNGQENEESRSKDKYLRMLRNEKYQLLLFFFLFVLFVPVLLFYFMLPGRIVRQQYTCIMNNTFRVPCGRVNLTEEECEKIECCFDIDNFECFHYLPSKYNYRNVEGHANSFRPTRNVTPLGNNSLEELYLKTIALDDSRVQIIISKYNNTVNNTKEDVTNETTCVKKFCVNDTSLHEDRLLTVQVRRHDGDLLLTTGLGPLIASKDYWEWTFYIGEDLFGLDELYFTNNETKKTFIYKNRNDNLVLPAFMGYNNGRYHGFVIENTSPMEIMVLPSKLIVLRLLTSDHMSEISVIVTAGPTPRDVMMQQRDFDFKMPPDWILKPQICRSGPGSLQDALDEYRYFLAENVDENEIHYSADCIHENLYSVIYSENDTLKNMTKEILDKMELKSTKFLMSLPPHIPKANSKLYDLAYKSNILYFNGTNGIYIGCFLGQEVAYPDFSAELIHTWFEALMENIALSKVTGGFLLNDNWAAEDTFEMEDPNNFTYFREHFISPMSYNLPWFTIANYTLHVYLHNEYGQRQAEVLQKYVNSDLHIFSSSYNQGMNVIAQVQHLNATWANLRQMIKTTLRHGIFAHPLISVPVCGSTQFFDIQNQEVLCQRWYIVAATMPLFRISSDLPRRDPNNLHSNQARNIALNAMERRAMFMPYIRTILSRGDPVMRPMFFDFYEDVDTFELDEQYMVGDAMLVAQILLRNRFTLPVYLPPSAGAWYEFFGGERYDELGWISVRVVESDWIIFLAEGKVIPFQSTTGDYYTLSITLSTSDMDMTATGSLYLSNATLTFKADQTGILISNINSAIKNINCGETEFTIPKAINQINLYGHKNGITTVNINVRLCDLDTDEYLITYLELT